MQICILGLGNLLWADEGFGVRAAERLLPLYGDVPAVTVLDGGTQGLSLLPYISGVDRLLILDAIDFAMPPGTLAEFRNDQVPAYLTAKKLSLHQTGFAEVLALMQLLNNAPEEIVLIGVQPVCLDDYGGSLTPLVKAQLPAAINKAIAVLRQWGIEPLAAAMEQPSLASSSAPPSPQLSPQQSLSQQLSPQQSSQPSLAQRINHHSLEMAGYEEQRPDSASACRIGDGRLLWRNRGKSCV